MTFINDSFENGWTDIGDQQQQPDGWILTWKQPGEAMLSAGAFPGDDAPVIDVVTGTPECVHKLNWQLPPEEQLGGENALVLDGETTFKVFRHGFSATLAQIVECTPGATLRLDVPVQVHNHDDGSYGACAARVWIDDTFSDWVTFGDGLVDREWVTLSVEAVVDDDAALVGIDLEGRAEADVSFFLDALSLTETKVPECRGLPRTQYNRVYFLLPQNATREQLTAAQDIAYETRSTVGFSADDAGLGDLDDKTVVVVWFSEYSWNRTEIEEFYVQYYPGTVVEHLYLFDDEPDPEPPDFTPENFTPYGTKAGFHGSMGDQGQVNIYAAGYANGVVPPTGKLVAAWGAAEFMRDCGGNYIVGRVIDREGVGNLEWFDSNRDPIAQAEARMRALLPIMQSYPAVGYWEIINEQNPPEAEDHANLARFFIRAMEIAEENGVKLACFSYSVGTPKAGFNGEPDYWQAIASTGVFEIMAAGGHALALHEYGQVPGDVGVVLCRYRHVYENHILPRGLDIPLIITEYGVTREYTHDHDFVFSQMVAYDNELRRDPYVAGFQCYIGPIGDEDYHDAYTDIQEPEYVDYMIAEKDIENG